VMESKANRFQGLRSEIARHYRRLVENTAIPITDDMTKELPGLPFPD